MNERTFEDLIDWSKEWFCKEPFVGKSVDADGNVTIYVNYATFGTAEGTGATEDEAKAACAADGWRQIEDGDFVSNDDDWAIYEAWRNNKPHPCKGWMEALNKWATEPDEEDDEEIYYQFSSQLIEQVSSSGY